MQSASHVDALSVWRVSADAEHYPYAYRSERFQRDIEFRQLDPPAGGIPIGSVWREPEYELDRDRRSQKPGTLVYATADMVIFVSEAIREEFCRLFGAFGEVKDDVVMDGRRGTFFAFNVLTKRRCIDWSNTEVMIPRRPTKIAVDLTEVAEGELFRDSGTSLRSTFSVEGPGGRGQIGRAHV